MLKLVWPAPMSCNVVRPVLKNAMVMAKLLPVTKLHSMGGLMYIICPALTSGIVVGINCNVTTLDPIKQQANDEEKLM